MKKMAILALATIAIFASSCGNSTTKNTETTTIDSASVQTDSTLVESTETVEGFYTPIN